MHHNASKKHSRVSTPNVVVFSDFRSSSRDFADSSYVDDHGTSLTNMDPSTYTLSNSLDSNKSEWSKASLVIAIKTLNPSTREMEMIK
jgi:hypothetical protein